MPVRQMSDPLPTTDPGRSIGPKVGSSSAPRHVTRRCRLFLVRRPVRVDHDHEQRARPGADAVPDQRLQVRDHDCRPGWIIDLEWLTTSRPMLRRVRSSDALVGLLTEPDGGRRE